MILSSPESATTKKWWHLARLDQGICIKEVLLMIYEGQIYDEIGVSTYNETAGDSDI